VSGDRSGPNLTAGCLGVVMIVIVVAVLVVFLAFAGVIDLGEWTGQISRWLDQ